MSLTQPLVSVRSATFIEVIVGRGRGTEEDTFRTVTMIFNGDGRCVAEHDPLSPTPWYAPEEECARVRRTT